MCKSACCDMKNLDGLDLHIALKQWSDLKEKFNCQSRDLAAKKADSQAVELANILNPEEKKCENNKKLTKKKIQQLAKNAFGNYQNKLAEDLKNGNSQNDHQQQLPSSPLVQGNVPTNLTLLQLLALNALDLTAPASNILLKNRPSKWIQLSGHEGSFTPAGPGTIWKKCNSDMIEVRAYKKLMNDPLSAMVPHFFKDVEYNKEHFIEMQDLLYGFKDPAAMDIKLGTRTFLESEVQNPKERGDLYEKMIIDDPSAATPQERERKTTTKLRYMQFRDTQTSSRSLGFRIEGFKVNGQEKANTDLRKLRARDEICRTMVQFLNGSEKVRLQLISRLQSLRNKLEKSPFFRSHEVVGSSILVIHDGKRVGAWMIDFGKTLPLPEGVMINHKSKWELGNHEEGYLTGLENLIQVLKDCGKRWSKG